MRLIFIGCVLAGLGGGLTTFYQWPGETVFGEEVNRAAKSDFDVYGPYAAKKSDLITQRFEVQGFTHSINGWAEFWVEQEAAVGKHALARAMRNNEVITNWLERIPVPLHPPPVPSGRSWNLFYIGPVLAEPPDYCEQI